MRTPCEWTLSEFVPRIKSNLARELKTKYNKNQSEIASILGVSQARISQYLKKNDEITRPLDNRPLKLMQQQFNDVVERSVSKILIELMEEGKSPASVIPTICAGCRELRTGNALCTLHMYDYQELNNHIGQEKSCDLCLRWKTAPIDSNQSIKYIEGRIDTIKTLEECTNKLLMKMEFIDYIPQIGAQLCVFNRKADEEHLRNVAAYPGRIIRYQDQARVLSKPQFFTSKTTASFLLSVREYLPSITAVLSIRNNNIRDINIDDYFIIETSEGDINGFIDQITPEITKKDYKKLAILDSGSIGYEAIAYFFVSNPIDLLSIFV